MLFLCEAVAVPAHDHRTAGRAAEFSFIVGTAATASEAQYVVRALRDAGLWRPPGSLENLIY